MQRAEIAFSNFIAVLNYDFYTIDPSGLMQDKHSILIVDDTCCVLK